MAFVKSGAVNAQEIREWFEPRNAAHVVAFFVYKTTGDWPESFLPSTVWCLDNGWQIELQRRIDEYPMDPKVAAYINEYGRVSTVVRCVTFPAHEFIVRPFAGTHFSIQVGHDGQVGRLWVIPQGKTDGHIIQTCRKALIDSFRDRVDQWLLWEGNPVFQDQVS